MLFQVEDNIEASSLLKNIFNELDSAEIIYCVERNYTGYPEVITGDVDLIVLDEQLIDASGLVKNVAVQLGWKCYYEYTWEKISYLGLHSNNYPNRFALTIELFAGARWRGIPFLKASTVLDERLKHNICWKPRAAHQAVITLFHHLLYNRDVPAKYRDELLELVKSDTQEFCSSVTTHFNQNLATQLTSMVLNEEWDEIEERGRKVKIALIGKAIVSIQSYRSFLRAYFAGKKANDSIPRGILILLTSVSEDTLNDYAEGLLELSNKWHLFKPPFRAIFKSALIYSDKAESTKLSQYLKSGGVAIVMDEVNSRLRISGCVADVQVLFSKGSICVKYFGIEISENISPSETAGDISLRVWNIILNNYDPESCTRIS